ncbi:unnamed protein product [Caenorhabditis auriculariae]|uniref:Uncharacterized protein n=1 Tax=Caenorhabditis auriculariae TaxID=2777116 RepID=A0A8S1HLR1_9PELO|nr:unnamed protein product [Caenorhabditis auriculariae]
MVAKSSRTSPPVQPPPLEDLVISVDEEPTVVTKAPATKKKQGWVKAAKSRATGTLRRTLFGRSTKRRAKDAEDVIVEQEEDDDDFTQSNYDTVKSLPASGHYGRSRVGHLHVDSNGELQKLDDAAPKPQPQPPVIIFKVPRRRTSATSTPLPPMRLSPGAVRAPLSDPVFDYYTWNTSDDS